MNSTAKKIALGLALLGSLVGGTFVWNESTRPEPLTFEEQEVLHKIWNYEIDKLGGTITLTGVNQDNLILKLDEKFSDPSKVETKEVKLEGEETLTATEYELLKAGIFKRAEQKTTLEEILNP